MKTTKYTRENLSFLNDNIYNTGKKNSVSLIILNGIPTVNIGRYSSLNAALNRICELEHRAKNSLRAKHMINEDTGRTLEQDIDEVIAMQEWNEKDEKEYEREDKINKIADTEINLVKDLFGIDVPTNVKNAYVKILDGIFDIIPSVF